MRHEGKLNQLISQHLQSPTGTPRRRFATSQQQQFSFNLTRNQRWATRARQVVEGGFQATCVKVTAHAQDSSNAQLEDGSNMGVVVPLVGKQEDTSAVEDASFGRPFVRKLKQLLLGRFIELDWIFLIHAVSLPHPLR